jgi:hypothetical protein
MIFGKSENEIWDPIRNPRKGGNRDFGPKIQKRGVLPTFLGFRTPFSEGLAGETTYLNSGELEPE